MKWKWMEDLGLIAHFSEPAMTDLDEGQSPSDPNEGGSGGEGPNLAVVPDPKPEPATDTGDVIKIGPRTKRLLEQQGVKTGEELDELIAIGEAQAQKEAAEQARQERIAAQKRAHAQKDESVRAYEDQYMKGLYNAIADAEEQGIDPGRAAELYRLQKAAELSGAQIRQELGSFIRSEQSRRQFFEREDMADLLPWRDWIEAKVAEGAPPQEVIQVVREIIGLGEKRKILTRAEAPVHDDIPLNNLPVTIRQLREQLADSGRTQGHTPPSAPAPEDDKAYIASVKALNRSMFGPSKGELWGG